jgi:hypothetical protein
MPDANAAPPPAVRPTAAIIPFPARPVASRPLLTEPPDRQRLGDALARLDAALAAQRAAVSDWRLAIADLRTTVGRLGDGLRRYDAALGVLGKDTSAVGAQAGTLERWADGVLAKG